MSIDTTQELFQQIIVLDRRIDRVESERVARMAELERIARMADTLALNVQARVAALEALVRDSDSSLFDAAVKRIEALEAKHATLHVWDDTWAAGNEARLEALEATGRSYLDVGEKYAELWSANHAVKHGELEKRWNHDADKFNAALKRIDELEEFALKHTAANAERERRVDWKATYNAAWPALAAQWKPWQLLFADPTLDAETRKTHDETIRGRLDWLHLAASNIADRAHGPLEAKSVPLKTLAVCSEVDALVKAVQEACDYALPDHVMVILTKAVEPFEQERGE